MEIDKFSEMAALGTESFEDDLIQPSSDIFNHGLSYYRAYLKIKDDPETSNPSYVCLAFAIEIFFKCLETRKKYTKEITDTEDFYVYKICETPIARSNKHDLAELFQKLSKETQEAIASLYQSEFNGDFHKDISAISKGFVEWRYIYEGKVVGIHVSTLQKIGKILLSYSQSVFKNT